MHIAVIFDWRFIGLGGGINYKRFPNELKAFAYLDLLVIHISIWREVDAKD